MLILFFASVTWWSGHSSKEAFRLTFLCSFDNHRGEIPPSSLLVVVWNVEIVTSAWRSSTFYCRRNLSTILPISISSLQFLSFNNLFSFFHKKYKTKLKKTRKFDNIKNVRDIEYTSYVGIWVLSLRESNFFKNMKVYL